MDHLKKFMDWLKEEWYWYGVACGFDKESPRVVGFIVDQARMYWSITICKVVGHDIEDDSYGGPESGYDGFFCSRCGESVGSQLY